MKLGVIGVGHLAEALLVGLSRAMPQAEVLLSPRGKGPALADRMGHTLATDNAALVASCDIVLLAVRPIDATEAVVGLPWRQDQLLLSACAGVPVAAFQEAGVSARIVRIMPIIAAEYGVSPTLVYPMEPVLAPLLETWGTIVALEHEEQFEVATTSAAIFGWVQALIGTSVDWSAAQGMHPMQARQLVAQTFLAAARMVIDSDQPIPSLLNSLATPGGITEAGLSHLQCNHVEDAWADACTLVLRQLNGQDS